MKRILTQQLFLFCFLGFFLFSKPAHTEDSLSNPEESQISADVTQQTITIRLGETYHLDDAGVQPFAENEEIISVAEDGNTIIITGLRVGMSEVLYWRDGNLESRTVSVVPEQTIEKFLYTPLLNPNKPYLVHTFQNQSTFDQSHFYQNAFYLHHMRGIYIHEKPYLSLTPAASFHYGSNSDFSLPYAFLGVSFRHLTLSMGQTSFSTYTSLPGIAGASITGMNASVDAQKGYHGWKPRAELFAGVPRTDDIRNTRDRQRVFGGGISITRNSQNTFLSDVIQGHFGAFQEPQSQKYHMLGTSEIRFGMGRHYSIDVSGGKAPGGYAGLCEQNLFFERGTSGLSYEYGQKGVRSYFSDPTQNEQHNISLNSQYLLPDYTTFLSLNANHDWTLKDENNHDSKSLGASAGVHRVFSASRKYGINYRFHRSVAESTSMQNGVSAQYVFSPIINHSFQLGSDYTRSDDQSSHTQRIDGSFGYRFENASFRYSNSISSYHDFSKRIPFSSSQAFSLSLRKSLSLETSFQYTNDDLLGDIHSLSLGEELSWYASPAHVLSVSSSASQTLGRANSKINGAVSLSLQNYIGPGVEDGQLWKKVAHKNKKSSIVGVVFIDQNYNKRLDKNETPLSNITIELDGKQKIQSSADGSFLFNKVGVGEHSLEIVAGTEQLDSSKTWSMPPKASFFTDGIEPYKFLFPISEEKGKIHIRIALDLNSNNQIDSEDTSIFIQKLQLQQGQNIKTIYPSSDLTLYGVDDGPATISIDPLDLPDEANLITPLTKEINIINRGEASVDFIFDPVRVIRGQVTGLNPLPQKLSIQLGEQSAIVDQDGYFIFRQFPNGDHDLPLLGLPEGVCIVDGIPHIEISEGSFTKEISITLTKDCQTPAEEEHK